MLKELLSKIHESGYFSRSLLALELQTSEQMVESGVSQLIRMGYMAEEPTPTCASGCGGCAFANNCNKEIVKMYSVTERGKALLGA
jgi:hypothetical protein